MRYFDVDWRLEQSVSYLRKKRSSSRKILQGSGSDGFKAHQDVQAGWDEYSPLHITLLSIDAATLKTDAWKLRRGTQAGAAGNRGR